MKDLTGLKFGKLTILNLHHREKIIWKNQNKGYSYFWLCQCECGNTIIVNGHHLKTGHTKSCGCLKNELLVERVKKHNLSNSRLNKIFRKMKQRCYNPNDNKYYYYGAKKITICDEWLNDFMNFYNWAMNNGYNDNLTIDRINVNGNYEPNNCRWVDLLTQANNKTNNHLITYNNETHTIAEWCRIYNIPKYKIYRMIKKCDNDVEALKICLT